MPKKIVDLEGQRGIIQILMALYDNGEVLSGKLYNNKPFIAISNNITAKRAIELLQKHGLISQKQTPNTRAIYYKLTEKGTQVAKLLSDMDQILNAP